MRALRSDLAHWAELPGVSALVGVAILGRALTHAWAMGDMTDEEASAFLEETGGQLLDAHGMRDAAH